MATDGAALFVQVGEARRPVCLDPPKEGLVDLREEGKPRLVTVNAQRYQAPASSCQSRSAPGIACRMSRLIRRVQPGPV